MRTHADIILSLGIRAVARELGHENHTTVQGWRESNKIPTEQWPALIAIAARLRESNPEIPQLTANDFLPPELQAHAA